VSLQIDADHLVGSEPAEIARRRRRQHARIGGEHVASGRQDVAATARRGAGRPRRDSANVQGGQNRNAFRFGARPPSRIVNVDGRAPIDMKSILDRKILEIAQPSIDAPQRIVGTVVGLHARFDRKPGPLGLFQDQSPEPFPPAPIKAVRLSVFVDKPFELAGVSRKARVDERGRQVADDHRGDPPLCLRGFPRIADDEGIDHGQAGDHQFREA